MNRALVVEDMAKAAQWLERSLHKAFAGIEVEIVTTYREGRQALESSLPDIALIDIGLPDGSGLDLLPMLHNSKCYPVVTTIFDDDQHIFSALRNGAKGYLLKDQSREELAALLQGIVANRPPLSPAVAQRMIHYFQGGTEHGPANEGNTPLTPREQEVLTFIAKGCTVPQVADLLQLSSHTVSGYVKELYRKLDLNSRAEATLAAARMGYITSSEK